jgi:hypothetical protein
MKHPNTIASILAGGAAWLISYALQKYAGIHLSKSQGQLVDIGSVAVVLFVGRRGIKDSVLAVWHGVWSGTPAPMPALAEAKPVVAAPDLPPVT